MPGRRPTSATLCFPIYYHLRRDHRPKGEPWLKGTLICLALHDLLTLNNANLLVFNQRPCMSILSELRRHHVRQVLRRRVQKHNEGVACLRAHYRAEPLSSVTRAKSSALQAHRYMFKRCLLPQLSDPSAFADEISLGRPKPNKKKKKKRRKATELSRGK